MYSDMSMRTQRALVVEQERRQRLGQFGLADAGGAEEHERARSGGWDPAIRRARGRTAVETARTASRWPTTRLASLRLHGEQLFALTFEHAIHRHAGPARDHAGNVIGCHRLFHQGAICGSGVLCSLGLGELLLEIGNDPVGEFAGALILALALDLGELGAGLVEAALELRRCAELALLGIPARGDLRGLLLEIGKFPSRAGRGDPWRRYRPPFFSASPSILRRMISPIDWTSSSSGFESTCIAQPRAGLVDEIDGLVGAGSGR